MRLHRARASSAPSFDLANLISKELGGARLTVAYVPQPLKGYAVLPVMACTEIVMGGSASLGPITPENQTFDSRFASRFGSWPCGRPATPTSC